MILRIVLVSVACAVAVLCALAVNDPGFAQNRVRTEVIKPPANAQPPALPGFGGIKFKADGHVVRPNPQAPDLEVLTDVTRLPPPVLRTLERIVVAARSGELHQLVAAMEANESMPVFSFTQDKAPIVSWKSSYPDSEGVEVLSILLSIVNAGYVRVDQGTAQELYLWPYFARTPLRTLTPRQQVELFRIVTGADYRDMLKSGAYSFYRLGIAPDGTWMFFVSGD
jgi:hypothetical protein